MSVTTQRSERRMHMKWVRISALGLLLALFLIGCFQETHRDITLLWDTNPLGENVTHYNVYQGTDAEYGKIGETPETTYLVIGLEANTMYYFVVTAVNVVGESEYSNEVSYSWGI